MRTGNWKVTQTKGLQTRLPGHLANKFLKPFHIGSCIPLFTFAKFCTLYIPQILPARRQTVFILFSDCSIAHYSGLSLWQQMIAGFTYIASLHAALLHQLASIHASKSKASLGMSFPPEVKSLTALWDLRIILKYFQYVVLFLS